MHACRRHVSQFAEINVARRLTTRALGAATRESFDRCSTTFADSLGSNFSPNSIFIFRNLGSNFRRSLPRTGYSALVDFVLRGPYPVSNSTFISVPYGGWQDHLPCVV